SPVCRLLVIKCLVGFKISLNHFNELFEQVFVFHCEEFFQFFAVLFLFYNLHDIDIDGFFLVAVFAFVLACMGVAQDNVFFTIVKEVANNLQQDSVAILIDTLDEILDFFFGGVAAQILFVAVQRNRLSFSALFSHALWRSPVSLEEEKILHRKHRTLPSVFRFHRRVITACGGHSRARWEACFRCV
ncbi:MAG: hypothetical protein PUD63_04770, partial [Clostridia bacterium]|nr:hypothetical protein [Clostridia bacterium]